MLNNIASLIVYLLEMLISYIFFSKIADKKVSDIKCIIIGLLLFESGSAINLLLNNLIWLNAFVFFLINIAFSLLCFDIKITKSVFYSLILDIFSTALEYVTIFTISVIFQTGITEYNYSVSMLLIEGIISKTLYFMTCLILARIVKRDASGSKFPLSFFLFPLTVIFALLVFWYICLQDQISEKSQIYFSVTSILLFASTILLFITYQRNVEKENRYILVNSELNRLKTEKTYYDILEHQNKQLMLYAHDAKNHLSAIKGLNKDPAIDRYINQMTENLSEYSAACHSGNVILDVILNRYKTESEMKGIRFSFDVLLSNLSFIDDFDIVTILGNLLDNALEAAEKAGQKEITFETDRRNSYDVIIISNSCSQTPIFNPQKELATTKKDKAIHGLGLKSVKNALKKYGGDISYEYFSDKQKFITTVMVRNPQSTVMDK